LAPDGRDLIAGLELGTRSDRIRLDARYVWLQGLDSRHEHHPVREDREQEVERGAGEQDDNALPDGALMERAVAFFRDDGPLVLVEHLHVAAERNHRDPVLNVIGWSAAPRQERPAEADREPEHFESKLPCRDEVAELVGGHEDADRDDEPQSVLQEFH
jgi:hypothetical protein